MSSICCSIEYLYNMAFNVMGAYSVVIAPQPCQGDKRRLRLHDGASFNGKCVVTGGKKY